MPFDLIIFDCDGVLVDSEPISNEIFADELARIGLPTSLEKCTELYMGKSEADCLKIVAEQLGKKPPPEFLKNYLKRTEEEFVRRLKPVQGIVEVLETIKVKKCVASSGTHEKMKQTLNLTGLWPYFQGNIFSATEVKRGKPWPDLFLYAAEKMKVSPEKCAVIEDSPSGVKAGISSGMKVFGYLAQAEELFLKDSGAVVFKSMGQLMELLKQN